MANPAVPSFSRFKGKSMSRIFRWGVVCTLWVCLTAITGLMVLYSNFSMIDFRVYYNAAQTLSGGVSPYVGIDGLYYLYPPLLAQLLMPLATTFAFSEAVLIWCAFNLVLILSSIILLSHFTPQSQRWLVWLIPPLFWGFAEAMAVGQVTSLMFALFVIAWSARKTNHPCITGAALAFATWIKIYPLIIIAFFLWKRDWNVFWSAALTGIILLIVQVMISGLDIMQLMLPTLFALSTTGQAQLLSGNSSVLGFTAQLFEPSRIVQPLVESRILSTISRFAISITLICGVIRYSKRGMIQLDGRFDLEYALVLLTSMLLSPTLWVSGMAPLALVFFLLWRNRSISKYKRFTGWYCLMAPLFLTVYYVYIMGYTPDSPRSAFALGFGFYILIVTWGVLVLQLRSLAISRQQLGILL